MENVVLWALSTGFVTGAVWVGIVLLRRRAGPLDGEGRTLDPARRRLEQLDDARERLEQLEQRLDSAERALTARRSREADHATRRMVT
jgi:hypothetical protein